MTLSICMDKVLASRIQERAKREGKTVSEWVCDVAQEGLSRGEGGGSCLKDAERKLSDLSRALVAVYSISGMVMNGIEPGRREEFLAEIAQKTSRG